MENVYKGSKAVLLFLFIILITQTLFGDNVAQKMSLVILFSMLVINSEKVATYLKTVTETLTFETTETTTTHTSSSGREHGGIGGTF